MNSKYSQKPQTSEKLKAKQYGAAALISILVAVVMTVARLIWGGVMLGNGRDSISLGFLLFYIRNVVLLFGAIDLVPAIYHFVLWNRSGRPPMDDDNISLFSDWKSGERSPVKVSLVLAAGIIALELVIVIQG